MKTLLEIKARHEAELKEAEQRELIASQLPSEASQICIHKDSVSVSYSKKYPSRYTFKEAYALFQLFTPIEAEHWKDGCLESRPAGINKSKKKERATMDGASIVEVKLSAGKGYNSHALTFWTMIGEHYVHVSIDLQPDWKWLPKVKYTYNKSGDCITNYCHPKFISEDQRHKWWSPEGSYQLSYYWADLHNFNSFASSI